MTTLLTTITYLYSLLLSPLAPEIGISISSLDVLGALRLCIALRQMKDANGPHDPRRSFARDALATLTVVYGGEVIMAPMLQLTPSFLLSPTIPLLFVAASATVSSVPDSVFPQMPNNIIWEAATAIIDAFTRSFLCCAIVPSVVLGHSDERIRNSAWVMIITSFSITNLGFTMTSLTSLLHPTPHLTLRTPPELESYGWTGLDLWSAPMISAIYSYLTQSQPIWSDIAASSRKTYGIDIKTDEPYALATCTVVMAGLFLGRVAKNYSYSSSPAPSQPSGKAAASSGKKSRGSKTKTQ